MSAPVFTPPPWLRETNLVYALDDEGQVNRFSAAVSGGFTNYRDRTHTTLDEQEANARLIAAAPELYEALENAREWLAGFIANAGRHADEELAQADAALAKARGQ